MTSMDNDDLLSAYADGELDEATTRRVEAWLADNPAAQRVVAMHRETSALLRAALAEGQFVREGDKVPARRSSALARRYGWAVAASILLVLAGFGAGTMWPVLTQSQRSSMLTEIAEYHS